MDTDLGQLFGILGGNRKGHVGEPFGSLFRSDQYLCEGGFARGGGLRGTACGLRERAGDSRDHQNGNAGASRSSLVHLNSPKAREIGCVVSSQHWH